MSGDFCQSIKLEGIEIQANGIIRYNGRAIGRLGDVGIFEALTQEVEGEVVE